jgi:hypothetical protein
MLLALKESNPGTVVEWDHKMVNDDTTIFERVFWAFWPLIQVFQYFHPLVHINETHLYGKYKAKILIAVSYDANNRIFFLLCYALVEEEMIVTRHGF